MSSRSFNRKPKFTLWFLDLTCISRLDSWNIAVWAQRNNDAMSWSMELGPNNKKQSKNSKCKLMIYFYRILP